MRTPKYLSDVQSEKRRSQTLEIYFLKLQQFEFSNLTSERLWPHCGFIQDSQGHGTTSFDFSRKYIHILKYSRLRYLLHIKVLVICFSLSWSGSILQFRHDMLKVGSKSCPLSYLQQEYKFESNSIHSLCFDERAKFL